MSNKSVLTITTKTSSELIFSVSNSTQVEVYQGDTLQGTYTVFDNISITPDTSSIINIKSTNLDDEVQDFYVVYPKVGATMYIIKGNNTCDAVSGGWTYDFVASNSYSMITPSFKIINNEKPPEGEGVSDVYQSECSGAALSSHATGPGTNTCYYNNSVRPKNKIDFSGFSQVHLHYFMYDVGTVNEAWACLMKNAISTAHGYQSDNTTYFENSIFYSADHKSYYDYLNKDAVATFDVSNISAYPGFICSQYTSSNYTSNFGVVMQNCWTTNSTNYVTLSNNDNVTTIELATLPSNLSYTKTDIYINNELVETINDGRTSITFTNDSIIGENELAVVSTYTQGDEITNYVANTTTTTFIPAPEPTIELSEDAKSLTLDVYNEYSHINITTDIAINGHVVTSYDGNAENVTIDLSPYYSQYIYGTNYVTATTNVVGDTRYPKTCSVTYKKLVNIDNLEVPVALDSSATLLDVIQRFESLKDITKAYLDAYALVFQANGIPIDGDATFKKILDKLNEILE